MRRKKKKDKRDDFLSLIPKGVEKILDVGCGEGNLSIKLREKGIEVVGIERDEKSYNSAKENINKVFFADVEKFQLPFPIGYFNCIIYADILEHLICPLAVLKNHRDFLNDSGYIIASIPNIRYYKIMTRLFLGGSWDYVDKGILDRSHLRFFTLINIKELFADAGYEIVEIKRNFVASRGFKVLNFFLFNGL
ncbi:MAG: class I SAM-dependent methyltransferase, partial [bacterium]